MSNHFAPDLHRVIKPCVCDICGKMFSIQHATIQHYSTCNAIKITSTMKVILQNQLVLPLDQLLCNIHYTCIVAGCTQGGKTVSVKKLLENAKTTISPPPERIIWFYGQWQPMYLEMIKAIPGIEFKEGIHSDIDSDEYLDVSTRNRIVLDDLMTQMILWHSADIFIKGSRHRNLSVIYIVQNIFQHGRETRKISLNPDCIVLFKFPRDKQQVPILARKVNPGHVQEFMDMLRLT